MIASSSAFWGRSWFQLPRRNSCRKRGFYSELMLYLLVETVAADDDSMVGEVEHFSSPLALIRVSGNSSNDALP